MAPNLPIEILLTIAEHFDPWTWIRNQEFDEGTWYEPPQVRQWQEQVKHLSCVSHSWHAAFHPLLKRLLWLEEQSAGRCQNLIQRALADPTSLAHYRTISFPEDIGRSGVEAVTPLITFNPKALQAAERISTSERWLEALTRTGDDTEFMNFSDDGTGISPACAEAELALLLTLLPNLQNLNIRLETDVGTGNFPSTLDLLSHACRDASLLPSLRRIKLSWYKGEGIHGYSPEGIEHILGLPQLRELDAAGCWSDVRDIPTLSLFADFNNRFTEPEICSNVQHLQLKSWDGNESLLRQLIRSCTKLRTFDLQFMDLFMEDRIEAEIKPDDIIRSLQKHENSLERLRILSTDYCSLTDENANFIPVGSLKSFTALRHLDLPVLFLVGKPAHAQTHFDHSTGRESNEDFEERMLEHLDWYGQNPAQHAISEKETLWAFLIDIFPVALRSLSLRLNGEESTLARPWCDKFLMSKDHLLPQLKQFSLCDETSGGGRWERRSFGPIPSEDLIAAFRLEDTIKEVYYGQDGIVD